MEDIRREGIAVVALYIKSPRPAQVYTRTSSKQSQLDENPNPLRPYIIHT